MNASTKFKFRLYVAGDAENSLAAIANLREICERCLPARHEVELIDVLVKLTPLPMRRIVGSLSQIKTVLQTLGLPALAA